MLYVFYRSYWNVNVSRSISTILLILFLSLGLFLLLLGACSTYEKELYLNFHNGRFRQEKSVFHLFPVGVVEGQNEVVLKYFSPANRKLLPDQWIHIRTLYRDSRWHVRSQDGRGAAILKIIQECNLYCDQLSDEDTAYVRQVLMKILNTASEADSGNMARTLEARIRSAVESDFNSEPGKKRRHFSDPTEKTAPSSGARCSSEMGVQRCAAPL